MARVQWRFIGLAVGFLGVGIALLMAQSRYSCAAGGGEECGPIAVDYVGSAVIVLATLGLVAYSLVRAFRPRQ
ncbi:hypothetical protein [Demequina zhanjiangensis]|uniref:Uncharacterized protein n=1 Tax=Demequina zhanjiangensis TaxID=3051659 RepID=A0ABT8G003_9MICO|nr:hypothetical protein [Demequina sp. SYSU T00b26]MDN4472463.1 hypothetical protein [Demequina sp. SYSU T00b26]